MEDLREELAKIMTNKYTMKKVVERSNGLLKKFTKKKRIASALKYLFFPGIGIETAGIVGLILLESLFTGSYIITITGLIGGATIGLSQNLWIKIYKHFYEKEQAYGTLIFRTQKLKEKNEKAIELIEALIPSIQHEINNPSESLLGARPLIDECKRIYQETLMDDSLPVKDIEVKEQEEVKEESPLTLTEDEVQSIVYDEQEKYEVPEDNKIEEKEKGQSLLLKQR